MNNVIATKEETQIQRIEPAVSESAAIIQVIERAAMNPAVDIDKMERLLEMQERITARNARAAYASAFAEMQEHLPAIERRGQGHGDIRYARWEDINEIVKPVLTRFGFGISFRPGLREGKQAMTAILTHREGHSEEATIELPLDKSGSKNDVQAVGSSASYGKRYAASAILNLTSRDGGEKDDDGAAAGGDGKVTPEQVQALQDKIVEVGADPVRFMKFGGVTKIEDIQAKDFAGAMARLDAKARKEAANG